MTSESGKVNSKSSTRFKVLMRNLSCASPRGIGWANEAYQSMSVSAAGTVGAEVLAIEVSAAVSAADVTVEADELTGADAGAGDSG